MASSREDRHIAIVGLGYVGLPLATAFVEAGLTVTGVDADPGKVASLGAGRSSIDDVGDARLAAALAKGLTIASSPTEDLRSADAIFVCVPTPIDKAKDPDLTPVLSAADTVRRSLVAGQLIVLQSTTYPGTTTGPFRGWDRVFASAELIVDTVDQSAGRDARPQQVLRLGACWGSRPSRIPART